MLDSLEQNASGYTQQFKDLVSGGLTDLGDDFTVTAGLKLSVDGYIDSVYYATGEDNSLFAKGSNYTGSDKAYTDASGVAMTVPANTALIANLRHLQNLSLNGSAGFTSNVGNDIKKAEQLCDIDCTYAKDNDGEALMKDADGNPLLYPFIPIENTRLTAYNGKSAHIFNLSTKDVTNAGLFSKVSSTLAVENCRVCWTDPGALVSGVYVYAVKGTNAGGLIGSVDVASGQKVTINNSFAAATVRGSDNAGGLIGLASGTVEITNSYADCYLHSNTRAGGLVGSGAVSKLENCYAAGFITGGTYAAGLLNGGVTNAPSNTYSVVRVITSAAKLEKPGTPLYVGVGDGGGAVRYDNLQSVMFELNSILVRAQDYSLSFSTVDASQTIVRRSIAMTFSTDTY